MIHFLNDKLFRQSADVGYVPSPSFPYMEALITKYSRDGDRAFFDSAWFPWATRVEAEWRAIRAELDTLLVARDKMSSFTYQLEGGDSTTNDYWKAYFLYTCGHRIEQNCRRCPETTRILGYIPGLTTAFFSILEPKSHIPPHRGPYKGVLRYHLGLLVPEPNTACRISGSW